MNVLTFQLDRKPEFKEWLLYRYTETPLHLHDVALATGSYRDYERLMEWYRRRYRYEMELREQLISANPFDD
ncbi:MAG: hypothetical protein K2H45_15630 [Acetatifactor sp.]|nr:hypothetical protein [Acetatifactor sp.]